MSARRRGQQSAAAQTAVAETATVAQTNTIAAVAAPDTTAAVTVIADTTTTATTATTTDTSSAAITDAGEEHAGSNRNHIASLLNIAVPTARCRTLILHTMQSVATDGKSKRLAADASVASAVILDSLLSQIVNHSLAAASAAGAHSVEVAHIHDGALSDITLLPLVSSLAEWTGYSPAAEAKLVAEHAAAVKSARDAKLAKKAADDAAQAQVAQVAQVAQATQDGEQADQEDDGPAVGFNTYVDAAWKSAKSANAAYANIKRKSFRYSVHISALLAGCLANLTTLAHVLVKHVADVSTLNASHMKSVAVMLLANGGADITAADAALAVVDTKLAVFESFTKEKTAEHAAKKAAEMTPEASAKAALAAADKQKAALARKQASAAKAAQAAADLAAQIGTVSA